MVSAGQKLRAFDDHGGGTCQADRDELAVVHGDGDPEQLTVDA